MTFRDRAAVFIGQQDGCANIRFQPRYGIGQGIEAFIERASTCDTFKQLLLLVQKEFAPLAVGAIGCRAFHARDVARLAWAVFLIEGFRFHSLPSILHYRFHHCMIATVQLRGGWQYR